MACAGACITEPIVLSHGAEGECWLRLYAQGAGFVKEERAWLLNEAKKSAVSWSQRGREALNEASRALLPDLVEKRFLVVVERPRGGASGRTCSTAAWALSTRRI